MQDDVVSHLNISRVTEQDGGEYACTATNSAGRVTHAARVNVYGLPFIREMPKVTAVAGTDLIIKCAVAGYPIESNTWERGRYTNEPKLDGVALFNYGVPMATFQLHHQTLVTIYCTKVLVKTNQTSPNSMGLRRLITEFLWPPSSSIIRLWLPHSTKVLGKTNQTSPNSMGLRRLITEFLWPPSSSIIRLWLPYSTKVLGKTNQTSPNSMGCGITGSHGHLPAPSSDSGYI
ncbi:Down syndrome cell adhesion molecule-like protein Dscam2 [Eumeta japonica]|uniref:Down syndrome cell adhesion molecule-like protein Dscam2 n=1 Tax=Eumeta variegata TaxID=151549 RepID=A0A4C1X502_EUMVA|nr:Down syndrome cell adhesion molecule-like protein Dscam2 [Eumeta japonica]